MTSYRIATGLTTFLLTSAAFAVTGAQAATCESLAGLKLPDTTITLAQSEAANSFTPPRGGPRAKPVPVAFCRVTGFIRPTSDSNIGFEVWLPATGWTGRYVSIGNGGLAGNISTNDFVGPLVSGSAVAGTDDGHQSPPAQQAEWALGHPEKLIDYGYRAVHLTAVISKAIAQNFYGAKPKRSYFVGCSTGGREALTEAQRYPQDFDGMIAGAPANQYIKLMSYGAALIKANLSSEAGFISGADAQKVGAAVTAQCDAQDGVKDGIINDPRQCRIDRASLPLTPAQQKTYDVMHDGAKLASGQSLFPGLPYGSEAVSWGQAYAGPGFAETRRSYKAVSSNTTFGNFVYHDPKWDFMSFDPDKSPADAAKAIGGIMDSTDPLMAAYQARGGKIISYHGWADAMITPLGTVKYYDSVIAAQGGVDKAQNFYRLFMVPGMGHCSGGPGANQFGQFGGSGDAEHDVVTALETWVEKGSAPSKLIATRYVDNDPAKGVAMTRPLCAYPKVTTYKGTGDTNDAANFVCAKPAAR